MAVCYFNNDYDKRYICDYEKKNNGIEVIVDYEIDEEIEGINGIKTFGTNTKFEHRDILIIDSKNKNNFLLKDAYYNGHSESWGTPDGGTKTKFFSRCYLYHKSYEKLTDLLKTPKTNKIRIYSNAINDYIGHPSLYEKSTDEEYIIKLQKEPEKRKIEIKKNNIKSLTISDDWNSLHSYKTYDINIKLNGYIEIETMRKINYCDINDYIKELLIYFQLLRPNKLEINKISIFINETFYGYNFMYDNIDYNDSYIDKSVNDDLLEFLYKCYFFIPYRNSKTEIRNIPYIILNTSRNLEDNFLMFYRTIECYYKKQKIKNIVNTFIQYSITNNYKKGNYKNGGEIENLSQEIICLRNHYVHSGYYIKNNSLKIVFKNIDNNVPNPKNYTVNNVNFDWIYERTKILYDIVIDIIFSNMLGYIDYKFDKHF